MSRIACCLAALVCAPLAAQEPNKESVVMRSIRNCAYIETPDGASGTGWVLDAEKRLIVTNQHVVANDQIDHGRAGFRRERIAQIHNYVNVTFPAFRDDGSLITEKSYYRKNAEKLIREGLTVRGTVVDADEARDLAVIVVDKLPPGVKAFSLAAKSQDPGDAHFSIGCPGLSEFRWVYGSGKVRSRGFQHWTSGPILCKRACQVLNTESQTNPGDSGGPVINFDGEIVGVTQGYNNNARSISYTIDLAEIKAYTRDLGSYLEAKTPEDFRRRAQFYMRRNRPIMAIPDLEAAGLEANKLKQPVWEIQLEFSAAIRAIAELEISRRAAPGFVNDPSQDQDLTKNFQVALNVCAAAMKDERCPVGKSNAELAAVRLAMLPAEAFIPVELKGPQWKPVIARGKTDPEYVKALAEEQRKHAEKWEPRVKEVYDGVEVALKADPKSALAYRTRARLESRKAKPDYATVIDDRTSVVKLLNTALVRDANSYLDRADAYASAKDYAKAIADCDTVLKIQPRSASAYVLKVNSLLAMNDTKAATSTAIRLVNDFDSDGATQPAIEPLNPQNWELLANACYASGDFSNQVRFLTETIKLRQTQGMPAERRLFADRGDAFVALKNYKSAAADYQLALLTPDFLGDKKPQTAIEQLYQSLYSIPQLQMKLRALSK